MTLLDELRTYLVSQGLVRLPRVTGSVPPMWLEPRGGVPAPGESPSGNPTEIGTDAVIGAYENGGIPPGPYNSFQRQDIVQFWVRVKSAPYAKDFERSLRLLLNDKRAWQMAGEQVIESELHVAMQLLTSDAQAFTYTLSYWFQRYA